MRKSLALTIAVGTTWALVSSAAPGNTAPRTVADYWQIQSYSDCVEMSASAIIGHVTGHAPTEAEITAVATAIGGYSADSGTSLDTIAPLFLHYGLVAAGESNMTFAQLGVALDAGYDVQAIVNAESIWTAAGYHFGNTGKSADHAVVVQSINADNTVTLVDPATSAHEVIPASAFKASWKTSSDTAFLVNAR